MNKSLVSKGIIAIFALYVILFFIIGVEAMPISHIPITFSFMFITLGLVLFIFYTKGTKQRIFITMVPFFLFNSLYLVRYTGEILLIVYQSFYVVLFILLVHLEFKDKHLRYLTIAVIPLIIFTLYLSTQYDNEFTLITSIPFYNGNPNSNSIGAYGYLLSYFPILYNLNKKSKVSKFKILIFVGIGIATVIFSGTRTMLIIMLVTLMVPFIWKYISKNKVIYNIFFAGIVFTMFLIVVIYPNLDSILPNFEYWNSLMIELTGKRILSGRNFLWQYAAQLIAIKPYFGYGSATSLTNFFFSQLETHNLYLEIALQVGIIGLIFLTWGLWSIWNFFWKNRHDKKTAISAGYFIGILLYQTFEVSLIQSGFDRGVLAWIIIGVGASFGTTGKNSLKIEKTEFEYEE